MPLICPDGICPASSIWPNIHKLEVFAQRSPE